MATRMLNDLAGAGACDCHIHVYEPGFPLAPTATFTPASAPASAYRDMQRELGLERAIVVQPTGYGFDNRCTLDAIRTLGEGARGVAVVPHGTDLKQLQALHAAGIRGVRFMMLAGGLLRWDDMAPMAQHIAALGWHVNLQLDGHQLPQHEEMLVRLPSRLVVDHLGKFLGPLQPDNPGVLSLCRLLDRGNCWVKLSAPYESSRSGPPDYADVAPLARLLASRYPERCLWASNWPHPNVKPVPSDRALLDWFSEVAGSSGACRRILVDNPAELYGFD